MVPAWIVIIPWLSCQMTVWTLLPPWSLDLEGMCRGGICLVQGGTHKRPMCWVSLNSYIAWCCSDQQHQLDVVSWWCGDKHSNAEKYTCVCVCVCVCVVGKEGEEKIEVGAKVTSEGVRPKREEVKEGKLL